jgi:hypothetical protein
VPARSVRGRLDVELVADVEAQRPARHVGGQLELVDEEALVVGEAPAAVEGLAVEL